MKNITSGSIMGKANKIVNLFTNNLRLFVRNILYFLYFYTPLPQGIKKKIKNIIFKTNLPFLKNTQAYRRWKENQKNGSAKEIVRFVAQINSDKSPEVSTRLIAFYLPQFHTIPENNKFWGEGFTEWTNVKSSKPQFKNHYQPHVPVNQDYYNLEDVEVIHQQATLAKKYGVSGFCFYFYWFEGKRLLEKPILQYLEKKDINFPFCLSWANENWTRRWDGLENEILVKQNHSKKDDIEFIKYISKYLKDERYIKVSGKPLILVCRPELLPSAKNTAAIWRKWCRENKIGEIFLAYSQLFYPFKNPKEYGFDATIEFPPNASGVSMVKKDVLSVQKDFSGKIYNWRELAIKSENYKKPTYKIFRGVNPGWDNTARRKNKGNILYGSHPIIYQKWLYNAIKDTVERFPDPTERLIFVNAWNEWAEGAHLEADQRYGYAYLEATRMAHTKFHISENKTDIKKPPAGTTLAIILHAFYIDIFDNILNKIGRLCRSNINLKLYITTTHDKKSDILKCLEKYDFPYRILPLTNHGRDILPFFKIIPSVIEEGHDIILKIHTKKSPHLRNHSGNAWREYLINSLMKSEEKIINIVKEMKTRKEIGMVAPKKFTFNIEKNIGSNGGSVQWLSERMGVDYKTILSKSFAGGSMFYASIDALKPILNLAISDNDFEIERGDIDGNFHHAIERAFSASLIAANKKLVDCNFVSQ